MVGGAEFERLNETTQCEIADGLESLLDVLARGRSTIRRLKSVPYRLDMESGRQQATVVIDGLLHLLRRLLACGLVHFDDVIAPDNHRRRRRTGWRDSLRPLTSRRLLRHRPQPSPRRALRPWREGNRSASVL